MISFAKNAAATVIVPKLVKSFRFSWLVYGAIAYLGLSSEPEDLKPVKTLH